MADPKTNSHTSAAKITSTHHNTLTWEDYDTPPTSAQPLPPPSPEASTVPSTAPKTRNTHHSGTLRPAQPRRSFFDPWNSSSTGHQRAENRLAGSTSWRASRSAKLEAQFRGGAGGGKRVADTVGLGSENFGKDGRGKDGGWERGASGLRERGQLAIWEVGRESKRRRVFDSQTEKSEVQDTGRGSKGHHQSATERQKGDGARNEKNADSDELVEEDDDAPLPPEKQIFRNLCFYVNGSTAPKISDHRLKRLLTAHGATASMELGRRRVSHVIIGRTENEAVGGGLAGGKLQKEIERVGGKGVKYVPVEWVIESVKRGKRLPEAGFAQLKVGAPAGQRSVLEMFKKNDGQEDA